MLAALAVASILALDGQAEVRGPALLCFTYSRFALAEDEIVEEVTTSLHGVTLTIVGPSGRYRVGENEIMRMPSDPGTLVRFDHTSAIYRSRQRASYGFIVLAPDGERERMLVVLEGEALSGGPTDAAIYDRVLIGQSPGETCDQRYAYGWSSLGE